MSLKKYLTLFILLLFCHSTILADIAFDPDFYRSIKQKKETDTFEKKTIEKLDLPQFEKTEKLKELEGNLVDISLPYQSNLNIEGRKTIAFDYGIIDYKNEDKKLESPSGISDGMQMNQELKMRINGTIGNKIHVGVNYDDTGVQLEKQDISVVYTGYKKGDITNPNDVKKGEAASKAKKDEIIEEIAFGNINLSLDKTEFFGYNKTLFGLSLKAKYKNLRIKAIGSQTEGITEKKVFTGNTSKEQKKIADTSYIKRRYYKLYFEDSSLANQSKLPIEKNSESIYLYDQKETTGETLYDYTAENFPDNATEDIIINGDNAKIFQKLNRGIDYDIDYVNGTIHFKTTINTNYVIAMDYTLKNEAKTLSELAGKEGKLILLKDSSNKIDQEIKSYYYLGNTNIVRGDLGQDFIFRVLNTNDVNQNFSYDSIEIDYSNGILKFIDNEPFKNLYSGNNFYDNDNITSLFTINVEYSYEKVENSTYMLAKTIIIGSEKITLNGQDLKRDIDYIIDYDIGLISLINATRVDSTSKMEITYEYLPFGGQFKQTLIGTQSSLSFLGDSVLGAGVIYTGTNKPREAPNIFSTPRSITVMDSYLDLNLTKALSLPFALRIKGEIAQSNQNPNIFGKAIIENMESSEEQSIAASDNEEWQVTTNPSSDQVTDLNKYTLTNHSVDLIKINTNINDDTDREVEVLELRYENLANGEEISIVDVINKTGVDYSDKDTLSLFLWLDDTTKNEITLSYGQIAEDADGNNLLSTEDLNGDGQLGINEDIGWLYEPDSLDYTHRIGANNAKLDSEDLDRNGILDIGGAVNSYLLSADATLESGWQKITIPLNIDTDNTEEMNKWKYIKHLRITVKNTSGESSGVIKFYQIAVKSNKWQETENLKVKAISKELDNSYTSIATANNTKNTYEELYGTADDDESINITETALELNYELGVSSNTTGHAIYRLPSTKKYDLSEYSELNFFLHSDNQEGTFFLHIGADEENYFEYTKEIDFDGWSMETISLEDTSPRDGIPDGFSDYKKPLDSKTGPRLENIKYFKVGIRNKTGATIYGKVYFNDIFVSGIKAKTGNAYRGEIDFTPIKGFKLSANAKHIDADFETLTTGTQDEGLASSNSITSGQEIDEYSGKLEVSRLKFMPMKFEAYSIKKVTPKNKSTAFSITEEGKTIQNTAGVTTRLLMGNKVPQFDFSVTKAEAKFFDLTSSSEANPYVLNEKQVKNYYSGKLSYNIPLTSNYYKQKIDGSYRYQKTLYDFYDEEENSITYAKEELEEESEASTDLFLLNKHLTLKPKYKFLKVTELRNHQEEASRFLKKREAKVEFDSEVILLKWLKPQFTYDILQKENYNIETASTQIKTKDITLDNRGSASLNIYLKSIFPKFKPTQSMNINTKFEMKDINEWDKVDKNYSFMNQLFTRDLLLINKNSDFKDLDETAIGEELKTNQITFTQNDTKTFSMKWIPLECLRYNAHWFTPLKNTSTRFSYTNTTTDSLGSYNQQTIWPEILLGVKEFENTLRLHRYVSSGDLSITYLKKQDTTKNTSNKLTNTLGTNYRFSLFRTFDCTVKYNYKRYKEFDLNTDLEKNNLLNETIAKDYALQVGLNYKTWRFTTRYDYSTQSEVLANTDDKWDKEHEISLKADTDFKTANGLKIPFIKSRFKVENRIRIDSELKAILERGALLKENKDTYSCSLDSEYNFTKYFQLKIGAEYMQVAFIQSPDSNYNATKIKTEASIIF
ncbi:MAG: hypothetical protein GY817_07000 [bacterium]|nr:hypothetical protein [bacterium]